jgi:pilus assembly protein Flp/PilA
MRDVVRNICRDEEGATIVEYALLLVIIATVGIAALTVIGTKVSSVFSAVAVSI